MLPNISQDVIEKMKVLQPGTCVSFGSAFKIPLICKLDMPNPRPFSASCNVSTFWESKTDVGAIYSANGSQGASSTPMQNSEHTPGDSSNTQPQSQPEMTTANTNINQNKFIQNEAPSA